MRTPITSLFFLLLLTACQEAPTTDLDAERDQILRLHEWQRDYHFNKDSIAFVDQLSTDFVSVNRGAITRPARAATLARYHQYFSAVEFVRWDDLAEPIIRFSDDGSLAYTIVDKLVIVRYAGEDGQVVTDTTHFAWTAIYRKHGGDWAIECVTSTEESGTE